MCGFSFESECVPASNYVQEIGLVKKTDEQSLRSESSCSYFSYERVGGEPFSCHRSRQNAIRGIASSRSKYGSEPGGPNAGRSGSQERRMHFLPHANRRANHAP